MAEEKDDQITLTSVSAELIETKQLVVAMKGQLEQMQVTQMIMLDRIEQLTKNRGTEERKGNSHPSPQ